MHPVCKSALLLAAAPLATITAFTFISCKSSSDVQCGPGTVEKDAICLGASNVTGGGDGGPGSAPTFTGVGGVAPASATSLFVTWDDAKSASSGAAIHYAVFVGKSGSPLDYSKPAGTTEPGGRSFYLEGLTTGQSYDVGVRAIDGHDVSDTNTTVKPGTPGVDAKAPAFSGVKGAAASGSGTVTLTWEAAQDDLTPASSIVYLVYVGDDTTPIDYGVPHLTTNPGATTVDVTGLYKTDVIHQFVVRARDASENVDANTTTLPARPGADTTPPVFQGCKSAFADTAGSAIVTWDPATDDATPAEQMAYDIFASTDEAHWDFAHPMATQTNTSSGKVTGLTSNTVWRFICRARDYAGNVDQNQIMRVAKTLIDSTPPTFTGYDTFTVDSSARTVTFSWAPGADDKTPTDQMIYDVYESDKSGGEIFTSTPRASSAPGASTLTVTDLTPDTTLYWVLRARDEGGNHDKNTKEASGAINVSFSRQVQNLFTHDCGVSGCHVPGNPVANLILVAGFAYDQLVSVNSTESRADFRVAPSDPDNSYLYKKITQNPPPVGWQMPAPATGSTLTNQEKDLVRRWILQGAVNN
jgi:hypothetical protein